MQKIERIKACVTSKSGKQTGVSTGEMKIPGMNIGTKLAPGGPTLEDVMWLIERLERCKDLIQRIGTVEALDIIKEIEVE